VKLGEVLKPVAREEHVNPLKEYRLLGVRLDGQGPFLRETVKGAQTAAKKLFRVVQGDFIYSRLFACRGAFGIIGEKLNNCYVSAEFPTFVPVSERVDLEFLRYWFRIPEVIARVDADCTGSTPLTRNRFKEHFFLALEIPLPPLAQQRLIVARIEKLAAHLNETRHLGKEIEKDINSLTLSAYHQIADNAPRKPMSEVAPLNRRPASVSIEKNYPQVAVRSFGKGTFHKPHLPGIEITWQKPFMVKAGDILISNIKAWEGAIAVAATEDDDHFGSHRYLTCVPISGVATPQFVCFHLLTDEGLQKVGEASPGSADRNRTLNVKALLQIPIPVPPFEKQRWFDKLYQEVCTVKSLHTQTASELNALLPAILDRAFKGGL
jgi:type I restriction enzyme S subunit